MGQFGKKQKQANITKSVFIHGNIVNIYKYVQYKNERGVRSQPSTLHGTQKDCLASLRVYRQTHYTQHAGLEHECVRTELLDRDDGRQFFLEND